MSRAGGGDAAALVALIRSSPRDFDSVWYAFFPPPEQGGFDVDDVLGGVS